jgi:hypothetical protein
MQRRGGKARPVDSGCCGGSRRRAATREHQQHWPRSWVPLARPGKTWGVMARVPQRPWRVSSVPNGDGRRTNGEGARDAGDCHAGERRREQEHTAWSAMGKRTVRQPDERALGKGADGWATTPSDTSGCHAGERTQGVTVCGVAIDGESKRCDSSTSACWREGQTD